MKSETTNDREQIYAGMQSRKTILCFYIDVYRCPSLANILFCFFFRARIPSISGIHGKLAGAEGKAIQPAMNGDGRR
jgi:hypothetical protein